MGKPAAKANDQVVGTDIHIVLVPAGPSLVPTPLPHPFAGALGGGLASGVRIAGQPAAVVGSTADNPPAHLPTPPGHHVPAAARQPGHGAGGQRHRAHRREGRRPRRRPRPHVQRPGRPAGGHRRRRRHGDDRRMTVVRDADPRCRRGAHALPRGGSACTLDEADSWGGLDLAVGPRSTARSRGSRRRGPRAGPRARQPRPGPDPAPPHAARRPGPLGPRRLRQPAPRADRAAQRREHPRPGPALHHRGPGRRAPGRAGGPRRRRAARSARRRCASRFSVLPVGQDEPLSLASRWRCERACTSRPAPIPTSCGTCSRP